MYWDDLVSRARQRGTSARQEFREEVQKAALASLSRKGAFSFFALQGGGALRFFHGSPRFSADLDFASVGRKARIDAATFEGSLRRFVSRTFPYLGQVVTRVRKTTQGTTRIVIETLSDQVDQRIRVHLEFAQVPSYLNEPKVLDYPPLSPVVRVEQLSEIVADKITALGNRPYVKGRDIWDLYFLVWERKVQVPWRLVARKANDYGATFEDLARRLSEVAGRLRSEGASLLTREMEIFLPHNALEQYRTSSDRIVSFVACLLEEAERAGWEVVGHEAE